MLEKNLISHSSTTSNVDEKWYLLEYPDVAAAGVSAALHYHEHGRHEGRFPKSLRSRTLEKKLWGGFSNYAIPEIEAIFSESNQDINERLYSALALARWHVSNRQWADGLVYANYISQEKFIPLFLKLEGIELIVTEIFIRTKNFKAAEASLEKIDLAITNESDKKLLEANLLSAQLRYPLALDKINSIYKKLDLICIKVIDKKDYLGIDNLSSTHSRRGSHKSEKKISVIMPAYNAEKHIATALKGILNQTWSNFELIVVDDASIDSTGDIVLDLAKTDKRIKYIKHHVRKGAYAARNTAWKNAVGDFVTNHDSDDWSHPQKLQLMVEPLLADNSVQLTMASWVRVDRDFMFIKQRPDLRLVHPSVSTAMFRYSALKDANGWDEVRVAADSELVDRLKKTYGPCSTFLVAIDTPLVIAQEVECSLTTSSDSHWRTEYFGLRDLYHQAYRYWHNTEDFVSHPLIYNDNSVTRNFPAPLMNFATKGRNEHYDIVFFSDFSHDPTSAPVLKELTAYLANSAIRAAVFHWPSYESYSTNSINTEWLQAARNNVYDFLAPFQFVSTRYAVLVCQETMAFRPDSLPHVSFKHFRVVSESKALRELFSSTSYSLNQSLEELLRSSNIFCSNWYSGIYPDIRNNTIDPFRHYIEWGLAEGRSPAPDICIEYYTQRHLGHTGNHSLALLHYLNKGRKLGYSISNPTIQTNRVRNPLKATILACAHAAEVGIFGAERCFVDVIEAMSNLGYNVIVTIPRYANMDYIEKLKEFALKVIVVPCPLWVQSKDPCEWTIRELSRIIGENSVRLVLSNTIMLREPLIAAQQSKTPSLTYVHEIYEESDHTCEAIGLCPNDLYSKISQIASCVIANSYFTASYFKQLKTEPRILPNFIDTREFDITNNVSSSQIRIGIISSNIEKKGISDFIELARKLEKTTLNAKFLIMGPNTAFLSSLLPSGPSNLEYVGYVESSLEAVAKVHIVLNMSNCLETFGRTILEGMAAGRVVIAYNRGALPELIDSGRTGYVVPFKDLNAMAEIIVNLCSNISLVKRIGCAAKYRVTTHFSKAMLNTKINEIITSFL